MTFKKGDVVEIRAMVDSRRDWKAAFPNDQEAWSVRNEPDFGFTVVAEPPDRPESRSRERKLWRYQFKTPRRGIVVGWSHRCTGWRVNGYWDEPPHFDEHERHRVIMVQPLHDERWLRPYPCLEIDLSPLSRQ